jgi:hypothetical protein
MAHEHFQNIVNESRSENLPRKVLYTKEEVDDNPKCRLCFFVQGISFFFPYEALCQTFLFPTKDRKSLN